jgi:hypothetical protein
MYLLLRRLVRLLANSSKDLKGDVEVVVPLMVLSATWTVRVFAVATLFMTAMSRTAS